MKITHRPLLSISLIAATAILIACALPPISHSFTYRGVENENIELLEWEYAGYRNKSFYEKKGFYHLSYSLWSTGDTLKIKWYDKSQNIFKAATLNFGEGMPIFKNNSTLKLSFSSSNLPEVYIFYESPYAHKQINLRGDYHFNKSLKMIYPEVKKITPGPISRTQP